MKWRTLWTTKRVISDLITLHVACLFRMVADGIAIEVVMAMHLEQPNDTLSMPGWKRITYEGQSMLRTVVEPPRQAAAEAEASNTDLSNWCWRAADRFADELAHKFLPADAWAERRRRRLEAFGKQWAPMVTVNEAMEWGSPWPRADLVELMPEGSVRMDFLALSQMPGESSRKVEERSVSTRGISTWLLIAFAQWRYPAVLATWLVHQLRDEPEIYAEAIAWWSASENGTAHETAFDRRRQKTLDEAECSPISSFILALHFFALEETAEARDYVIDGLSQLAREPQQRAREELALRLCEAWEGDDA